MTSFLPFPIQTLLPDPATTLPTDSSNVAAVSYTGTEQDPLPVYKRTSWVQDGTNSIDSGTLNFLVSLLLLSFSSSFPLLSSLPFPSTASYSGTVNPVILPFLFFSFCFPFSSYFPLLQPAGNGESLSASRASSSSVSAPSNQQPPLHPSSLPPRPAEHCFSRPVRAVVPATIHSFTALFCAASPAAFAQRKERKGKGNWEISGIGGFHLRLLLDFIFLVPLGFQKRRGFIYLHVLHHCANRQWSGLLQRQRGRRKLRREHEKREQ